MSCNSLQANHKSLLQGIEYIARRQKKQTQLTAAYIGAANGDLPEYYDIFASAMESVGIGSQHCRMISQRFLPADQQFIESASLILLAGGDCNLGLRILKETGMGDMLLQRYTEGAILIGVGEGSVMLGRVCYNVSNGVVEGQRDNWLSAYGRLLGPMEISPGLGIVPYVISCRETMQDYSKLHEALLLAAVSTDKQLNTEQGFAIASGGALMYYPDGFVEAVGNQHPISLKWT